MKTTWGGWQNVSFIVAIKKGTKCLLGHPGVIFIYFFYYVRMACMNKKQAMGTWGKWYKACAKEGRVYEGYKSLKVLKFGVIYLLGRWLPFVAL
jgi:hypothetical protein